MDLSHLSPEEKAERRRAQTRVVLKKHRAEKTKKTGPKRECLAGLTPEEKYLRKLRRAEEWRRRHPERVRKLTARWRAENPERVRLRNAENYRRRRDRNA